MGFPSPLILDFFAGFGLASVEAEEAAFSEASLTRTRTSLPFAMAMAKAGISRETSCGAPPLWLPSVDEATPDDAAALELEVRCVWEAGGG